MFFKFPHRNMDHEKERGFGGGEWQLNAKQPSRCWKLINKTRRSLQRSQIPWSILITIDLSGECQGDIFNNYIYSSSINNRIAGKGIKNGASGVGSESWGQSGRSLGVQEYSRSISMVIDGKFFEKGFISESKFLNESTPSGQKILPKVPL